MKNPVGILQRLFSLLEDEVVVAWNGPPIPHADRLIKATIDRIQGIGAWHFHRISETSRLKFYRVSEAVK